jgi:hypothetical protein
MEIMTEEYCRQCPFFIPDLGYLKADDPYWKTRPDNHCVCAACPRRQDCERDGPPEDISFCIGVVLDQLTPTFANLRDGNNLEADPTHQFDSPVC